MAAAPLSARDPLALARALVRFARLVAGQRNLSDVRQVSEATARALCLSDTARLLLIDPVSGELEAGVHDPARVRVVAEAARPALTPQAILVPLLVGGDILGVIEVTRQQGGPPFEEPELELLRDLAAQVAIAIQGLRTTEALRAAQAEVLEVNQALEEKISLRTRQLTKGKQEWERTFDAIQDPIALQSGFVLRRVNRAYARRVGVPVTQVPGRKCHELFAGRDSPCVGCPLLSTGGPEPTQVGIGDSLFQLSSYPLSEGQEPGDRVLHYQDITAKARLEDRLRQTERLAAVGQLASGAAHEINNPLAFLTANLRHLTVTLGELEPVLEALRGVGERRSPAIDPERLTALKSALARLPDLRDAQEMVTESLEGARRVEEIVKGLRELSRLEVTRPEPTCVNESIRRVLRSLPQAPRPALDLAACGTIQIPPLQLDRALESVLRNAVQAVKADQAIRVRTWDEDGRVCVEIADEGTGMTAQILDKAFDPFFTTRGIGRGVGLGLTAAYGIVQRAGGEIKLRSQPGRGTVASLVFPRSRLRPTATLP